MPEEPPDDDFLGTLRRRPLLFPSNGWMADYLDYASSLTDAPPIYHLATGLAVLSATLGNSCWLHLFGGRVFPSTWHVLLGGSSIMRKSTSMRIGLGLLQHMDGAEERTEHENTARGILLPMPGSREGLQQALQKRGEGILPVYEFGELLAHLSRDHMAGTKEALTSLYDGDSSARATKGDQTKRVKDPAVTMLGASTPDWLEDRAKEGDIRGGFLARVIWWPAAVSDKNGWMDLFTYRSDAVARDNLANRLTVVRKLQREVRLSDEAKAAFVGWQRQHEAAQSVEDFPKDLLGFHARMPVNVLKLAVCLEGAQCRGIPVISEVAMQQALRIGRWLVERVAGLFGEEMAFTPYAGKQRRFMEAVGNNGAVPRRDMMRRLRWSARELTDVASSLRESGRVAVTEERPEHGGPAKVFYRRIESGTDGTDA